MKTLVALPLRLAVLGAALVAAGLHSGGHAAAVSAASAASADNVVAFEPPAFTPKVSGRVEVAAAETSRPGRAEATLRRARPAPSPRTTTTTAPSRPATVPVRHSRARRAHSNGPTGWAALDAAIARIPTYRPGAARWVVSTKWGYWGTADWYHDVLYVNPSVPNNRLYDVAVHEWSHELSVLAYGGDVAAATRAMNAVFGGSGLVGAERAADCMSILQGATWTHYTACTDARWRAAAAKLVAGRHL